MTSGREVYDMVNNKAVVKEPLNCMVGCSTCGTLCPVQAISFPERDLTWKTEREHRIFAEVRREAQVKKTAQDAAKVRAAAEDIVARLTMRVHMDVAGEFGEKRFLVKLEELIQNRPYDIVNLHLEVPTVKGTSEKTPAFMSFEVTSTSQEDIETFLPQVRSLVRDNGLVIVNERKL